MLRYCIVSAVVLSSVFVSACKASSPFSSCSISV